MLFTVSKPIKAKHIECDTESIMHTQEVSWPTRCGLCSSRTELEIKGKLGLHTIIQTYIAWDQQAMIQNSCYMHMLCQTRVKFKLWLYSWMDYNVWESVILCMVSIHVLYQIFMRYWNFDYTHANLEWVFRKQPRYGCDFIT